MTEADAQKAFLDDLIRHKLLLPTGVRGLYGRNNVFEDVLVRFDQMVSRDTVNDGADKVHFPPILARSTYEKSGHLKSFPELAGGIFSFTGKEAEHQQMLEKLANGEDWTVHQKGTDVVMTPAACYPVYPTYAGKLPEGGKIVDLASYCFRHEPSDDPARMQIFRQREVICLGSMDTVRAWRESWMKRGLAYLKDVGLPAYLEVANDPFFGRRGKMLAANQRDQELKFEILCPITSVEKPTAITSFNWHQDYFASTFGIQTHDGQTAQTACLGFGLERITLALFKTHGFVPAEWPTAVRAKLWP